LLFVKPQKPKLKSQELKGRLAAQACIIKLIVQDQNHFSRRNLFKLVYEKLELLNFSLLRAESELNTR